MRKKILCLLLLSVMTLQLSACSFQQTCKADGCDETEIYQDGYCKYHYYLNTGESILKDIIN